MQRKNFSAEFKAKVALEAIKEQKTINQIASEYEVHVSQVSAWKKQALEQMAMGFTDKRKEAKEAKGDEAEKDRLYSQIGQLKVENDWLKKKSGELLKPRGKA